jgi:hypothetical protein
MKVSHRVTKAAICRIPEGVKCSAPSHKTTKRNREIDVAAHKILDHRMLHMPLHIHGRKTGI